MKNKENTLKITEDLEGYKDVLDSISLKLGRELNELELLVYSAMWAETISYKSSYQWVKSLPSDGDRVIVGAGVANSGAVDIGNDLCCVFKMGSHNHPSGIDPYEGAATCVGDVIRDVASLGAKPIISLNSFRFGNLNLDRTKWLMDEVKKGVYDYSSLQYVKNINSEIRFNSCYDCNPLVNVLVAGLVNKDHLIANKKINVGNAVFMVGNTTSDDGVSIDKASAIAKSNPDLSSSIIKCILELTEEKALLHVENMDIAGLVSACSAIGAKTEFGLDIELNKIPLEKEKLSIDQILLSRTQERMMLVVDQANVEEVKNVFNRSEVLCTQIGSIVENKTLTFFDGNDVVAEFFPEDLVMGHAAPQEKREYKPSEESQQRDFLETIAEPDDYWKLIRHMLKNKNIGAKSHIQLHNQVEEDHSPSDAIVLYDKNANPLCFTISGNSNYCNSNTYVGTQINMAMAVRRITCSGGKAIAINDCLNFGSLLDEKVYAQLVESVEGLADACKFYNIPVLGGNVSFYNESTVEGHRIPIQPTPVIAMMGMLDSPQDHTSYIFRQKGDMIFLIGQSKNDIAGSQYLQCIRHGSPEGLPYFSLKEEKKVNDCVQKLIKQKLIVSAHSVDEGGLFFNLVSSAMPLGFGFDITSPAEVRKDAFLFGESQSRVVVSVSMENEDDFIDAMMEYGLSFSTLGHVTKGELRIDDIPFGFIDDYKTDFQLSSPFH
ncbi:AIR synthase related protein [Ancylomarina sp. DW003]|nr:AIR synthase related protein [Ancylomarina sp. DW003]MDE5423423.1 AIR synthase related protein [Ancylomarina sp. DW003]